MKHTTKGLISLMLTLIMLLSAVLFGTTVIAADSSNLNNFVTGAEIFDGGIPIPDGTSLVNGKDYKIVIKFKEDGSGQFENNGILTYTLPSQIKLIAPITNGVICLENGSAVGTYKALNISTGVFTVTFGKFDKEGNPSTTNFVASHTDVTFELDMNVKFDAGSAGETIKIEFGDDYKVDFNIGKPKPGITVAKDASDITLRGGKQYIDYKITISAKNIAGAPPITGITLVDKPYARTTANGSPAAISTAQQNAYSGFSFKINGGTATPMTGLTWVGDAITYNFGNDVKLNPSEKIEVTYTLDVAALLADSGLTLADYPEYYVGNEINVTSENAGNGTAKTQTTIFGKAATKVHDGKWIARVGNGSATLNGATITDEMSSDSSSHKVAFPTDHATIIVRFYTTPELSVTSSYTLTAQQLSQSPISSLSITGNASNGETLTLTVPADSISTGVTDPTQFGTIYGVQFEYNTTPPIIPDVPYGDTAITVKHTNKISLGAHNDSVTRTFTGGVMPNPHTPTGVTVNKRSSGPKLNADKTGYEIEYEVTIDVPAGNYGKTIYFYDELAVRADSVNIASITNRPIEGTLSVEFNPSASEPEIAWRDYESATLNRWGIYFGSGTASKDEPRNPVNTSLWPRSAQTTITIRYSLDLSSKSYGTGVTPTSVYDLLSENITYYLRNTANIGNGSNYGYLTSAYVIDAWPIHKTVEASDTDAAVFDYTVKLNGTPTTGAKYVLFNSSSAQFADEFDSILEYVPGSFYVTIGTNTTTQYRPADSDADAAIYTKGTGTSKLSVDLSTLKADSTGTSLDCTVKQTYVIHYQLCVPNPAAVTSVIKLNNNATIDSLNGKFSSDASIHFDNTPLTKEMVVDGGRTAEVEIYINPSGWKLTPDIWPNKDGSTNKITAIDKMSSNLSFEHSTIKVEVRMSDGTWVIQTVTESNDGALWTWSKLFSENAVCFVFPDETPIRITYNALVTAPMGSNEDIWNKIVIESLSVEIEAREASYIVQNSSAMSGANLSNLHIEKYDGQSDAKLPGAEFDLYMALGSNNPYAGGELEEKITIGSIDFYKLETTDITDSDGKAGLTSPWLTPTHKALYLLEEITTPTGYVVPKNLDKYTFFLLDFDEITNWKDKLSAANGGVTVEISAAVGVVEVPNSKIPPDPGGPTDPEPTDPKPTDPEPTDPEPTDPGPTDLEPLDIEPIEPEPTVPVTPGGTDPETPPNPTFPGNTLIPDGEGWIELDEDGVPLGRWEWDEDEEMWMFDEDVPLAGLPSTGYSNTPAHLFFLMGATLLWIGLRLTINRRKRERQV